MLKTKPRFRHNPDNSIIYTSEFFKSDQQNNFAFCQVYNIQPEHGRWTRNLDIVSDLYVEKYELINGKQFGLYEYCKSLANRRKQLSIEGLAYYFDSSGKTIVDWLDRLQDVRLIHRVCRADSRGGGHDIVIHTPSTYELDRDAKNKAIYSDEPFRVVTVPFLRERIALQFTKSTRSRRLVEKTFVRAGASVTMPMRSRESCCPEHLRLDMRELNMLFETGKNKQAAGGKIPRRFWKPSREFNLFVRVCLDALRDLYKQGFSADHTPGESPARTRNWKTFQETMRRFCEDERVSFTMNDPRWKAAWWLGCFYAPNVFHYAEI